MLETCRSKILAVLDPAFVPHTGQYRQCPVHNKVLRPLVPYGSQHLWVCCNSVVFLPATLTDYPPREVWGCSGGWSLRVLVKGFMDDTEGWGRYISAHSLLER